MKHRPYNAKLMSTVNEQPKRFEVVTDTLVFKMSNIVRALELKILLNNHVVEVECICKKEEQRGTDRNN